MRKTGGQRHEPERPDSLRTAVRAYVPGQSIWAFRRVMRPSNWTPPTTRRRASASFSYSRLPEVFALLASSKRLGRNHGRMQARAAAAQMAGEEHAESLMGAQEKSAAQSVRQFHERRSIVSSARSISAGSRGRWFLPAGACARGRGLLPQVPVPGELGGGGRRSDEPQGFN